MSNFFLHNKACDISDLEDFINGIQELNAVYVGREDTDTMLKHQNIWNLSVWSELYIQNNQYVGMICGFVDQLTNSSEDFETEESFDCIYKDEFNAFLGIDFRDIEISSNRQITNKDDYLILSKANLWDKITSKTFWKDKTKLFPSITFCDKVETQCAELGNSPDFYKILFRLKELNNVAKEWTVGAFNHKEVVANVGLIISTESESTLNNEKFRQERIFKLPSGDSKLFDLHIKIGGGLRICFYPDNDDKKIYVGYIGKHLSTTKYN